MSDAAYPGPFVPDNPVRRLPWILAIAVLLVLLALLGLGRMLHPPVATRPVKPEPLQARIYELPASRGSAASKPASGGRHSSVARPAHRRSQTQHTSISHRHQGAAISIPRVAQSMSAVPTQSRQPLSSHASSMLQPARPHSHHSINWATLQSQVNAAISQSDPSSPQIHDPHTLVARYYLASILEKLQRIGEMNDPTRLIGMPVIRLVIGRHGELQQLSLLHSSGSDRLDHAALQIARESAPFAPFPDSLSRKTQHIAVVCYMKFVGYRQIDAGY